MHCCLIQLGSKECSANPQETMDEALTNEFGDVVNRMVITRQVRVLQLFHLSVSAGTQDYHSS